MNREVRKSVSKNRLLEEIFKSIDAEYERIRGGARLTKNSRKGARERGKKLHTENLR